MPKRKNKADDSADTKEKSVSNNFELTIEKKRKIYGFILIILGIISLLSIISYHPQNDEIFLYLHSTGTPAIDSVSKSDSETITSKQAANYLGPLGANIASYLIYNTFGYFSIIFPLLMLMWGYGFFKEIDLKKKLNISLFLVFFAVINSALIGVLLKIFASLENTPVLYLSGSVGRLIGTSLYSSMGGIGAPIILFALLIILFVFAFDFKVEKIVEKGKTSGESILLRIWHLVTGTERIDETEDEPGTSQKPISETKIVKPKKEKVVAGEIDIKAVEPVLTAQEKEALIKINRVENSRNEKAALVLSKKNISALQEDNEQPASDDAGGLSDLELQDDSHLPDPWDEQIDYEIPAIDEVLEKVVEEDIEINDKELKLNARQLQEKLRLFDIAIENIEVFPGPVVTMYEITPSPGVKISKIVSLENDIAMALAARGIRIIAPIPGKSAIGVEIPNAKAQVVSAYSIMKYVEELQEATGKVQINGTVAELPLGLGKTIIGNVYIGDLAKIPHLLVAGSTGSGKSVGINMIITSLLLTKKPSEVKFAIIDPKKIELSFYQKLRYHYLAVCPDLKQDIVTDAGSAKILLKSLEIEMDMRYDMLANAGVKGIIEYNKKISNSAEKMKVSKDIKHHYLPYIVVVIDELADLMMTSGKEVEEPIARIAQLARAVGIHLIVATQRPSVDVITGMIKANFNARIAYQVATKVDSRTILDMNGAEQLLGRGDMLYLPPGTPKPIRLQNAFISVAEVEKLTQYIGKQAGFSKPYFLPSLRDKKTGEGKNFGDDLDALFEDAAKIIVQNQQGSVSLLQRRLKLGYARAARIVDQLEQYDIVGPNDGSKAREVKIKNKEELETKLRSIL